jgi:hypothetical protein
MAEDQTPKTDFPSELVAPVKNFQDSLNKVNEIFEPLHSQPLQDLVSKNELDALSKAKLDTVSAFAVNNLVWMWLRTKGENPKDAGVLAEINRVKKSMYELVACFHEFLIYENLSLFSRIKKDQKKCGCNCLF